MAKFTKNIDPQSLGDPITTWVFKPAKTQKTVFTILGVLGGLLITFIIYGSQFFPWFKKISTYLLYLAIFALSPLVKYLSAMGKDYYYELYVNGFVIRRKGSRGLEIIRQAAWDAFESCQRVADGVKLASKTPFERSVKLNATANVMEVFSICSEKINNAKYLHMAQRKIQSDWERQRGLKTRRKSTDMRKLF